MNVKELHERLVEAGWKMSAQFVDGVWTARLERETGELIVTYAFTLELALTQVLAAAGVTLTSVP